MSFFLPGRIACDSDQIASNFAPKTLSSNPIASSTSFLLYIFLPFLNLFYNPSIRLAKNKVFTCSKYLTPQKSTRMLPKIPCAPPKLKSLVDGIQKEMEQNGEEIELSQLKKLTAVQKERLSIQLFEKDGDADDVEEKSPLAQHSQEGPELKSGPPQSTSVSSESSSQAPLLPNSAPRGRNRSLRRVRLLAKRSLRSGRHRSWASASR